MPDGVEDGWVAEASSDDLPVEGVPAQHEELFGAEAGGLVEDRWRNEALPDVVEEPGDAGCLLICGREADAGCKVAGQGPYPPKMRSRSGIQGFEGEPDARMFEKLLENEFEIEMLEHERLGHDPDRSTTSTFHHQISIISIY
jgi:hypothetical protein